MKKNEKVKTQELSKLGGEQRSLGEAPPSYHWMHALVITLRPYIKRKDSLSLFSLSDNDKNKSQHNASDTDITGHSDKKDWYVYN